MSPEQILGKDLDGRSDVFSLGVVLWESLVRRKLYNQENDLKLLQAITEEEAPSPRRVDPEVPELLAEVTRKALARKPEERYQSAAEFRSALRRYLKATLKDWDNVVIGRFMQDLFSDRVREKRQLIDNAQASEAGLQDYLFGDLSDYLSDTEHSVPRSPVSESMLQFQPRLGRAGRRRPMWLVVLVFLGILAGAGTVGLYVLSKNKPGGESDRMDAGVVAVIEKPDAGTEPGADPQVAVNPLPLEDAGVAPADEGEPEKVAKPRKKKKKKKKRRRRKIIVKKPEEKIEKPPPGPPGKLRLTTSPWTDVYHRGKHLGQTPLIDVELPSGHVKLRVVNKEHGIDKTITVVIKPGEKTTKRFNLF
jgi:serine/threonine-protein kinase